MERLRELQYSLGKVIGVGVSNLVNSNITDSDAGKKGPLFVFSDSTQAIIELMLNQSMAVDTDKQKLINLSRKIVSIVPMEISSLRSSLSKANKDSDDALCSMEKWAKRETETLDYATVIQNEEQEWLEKEQAENSIALSTMRSYIPIRVGHLSVHAICQQAKDEDGLMTLELATELKNNKLLHWLVTHVDDITTANFLTGDKKSYFENLESLDIVELRSLAVCVPMKFELDKDGKKAEWRTRMMTRAKQLVSQYNGDKVKGAWDEVSGKRVKVPLPQLKPDQLRRPVYYYRTKEQSDLRLKGYDDKAKLLVRKETWLANAEREAVDAKKEYETILTEMRDPAFKAQFGVEQLSSVKDMAKKEHMDAEKKRKSLAVEVVRLQQTIKENPCSREQFIEIESQLQSFLAANGHPNWHEAGQAPIQILGVFDPVPEITKRERETGAKFVSAEEEAEQRKHEMDKIFAAKGAAIVAIPPSSDSSESFVLCSTGLSNSMSASTSHSFQSFSTNLQPTGCASMSCSSASSMMTTSYSSYDSCFTLSNTENGASSGHDSPGSYYTPYIRTIHHTIHHTCT